MNVEANSMCRTLDPLLSNPYKPPAQSEHLSFPPNFMESIHHSASGSEKIPKVIQPDSAAANKLQQFLGKGALATIFSDGPGPLGAFDHDEDGSPVEKKYVNLWELDAQDAAEQRRIEYMKKHSIQA